MSHNLIVVACRTISWLLTTIDLHSLIDIDLLLFEILLFALAATALALEILTAVIREIVSLCFIRTAHFLILNHSIAITLSRPFGYFDSFLLLLFNFISTIFFAIGNEIGFWLLRWELWRSRCFGIPTVIIVSSAII